MTEYIEEVNITEDGGIVKKMIARGEGGCPSKGEQVAVEYEGRLEDGTVFDSSKNHGQPLEISIGTGQVIQGWDQGIIAMELGEKADLVIQSNYGYGDRGSPPKIPGGATLIFTVQLLQIGDRKHGVKQLSEEELMEVALKQKDLGNAQFKDKKFEEASVHYREALSHLTSFIEEKEEINKLKITCYQNLSVALNAMGKYNDAVVMCSEALQVDDKAAKALYLRGIAHMKLKNFDEATEDMKAAIKLNPQDKKLRTEFENIKNEKKKHNSSQAAAMQNMFKQGMYNEKSDVKFMKNFDKLPDFDPENA